MGRGREREKEKGEEKRKMMVVVVHLLSRHGGHLGNARSHLPPSHHRQAPARWRIRS